MSQTSLGYLACRIIMYKNLLLQILFSSKVLESTNLKGFCLHVHVFHKPISVSLLLFACKRHNYIACRVLSCPCWLILLFSLTFSLRSWLPTPPSMIWWLVCVVCMLAYPCTFIICSFYNIGSVSWMIFKWLCFSSSKFDHRLLFYWF